MKYTEKYYRDGKMFQQNESTRRDDFHALTSFALERSESVVWDDGAVIIKCIDGLRVLIYRSSKPDRELLF